ncbi:MAG: glycosyltransferase family 39 protein [Chloroflexi bacterium]|nr:glycosyltransferase family 39 protein [Chloroflexota bacterium]
MRFSPSPLLPLSPSSFRTWFAFGIILLIAAFFRFAGLAWDSGYLFHPDERKILLVVNELALPENLGQAFSPDSPLSPKFFAYGSLPIYLLKALSAFAPSTDFAVPWRDNQLVGLAILGRALSAIFDLGTIVFTFLLARRLYDARVGLIASACIVVTVLHIQIAHFYAVDTLLTMLVVATVFFAARYASSKNRRDEIAMAVAFGLALATKISAAPLVVPIVVAILRVREGEGERGRGGETQSVPLSRSPTLPLVLRSWVQQIRDARKPIAKILGIALAIFFITQPYILLDPIRAFGQIGTEMFVARGWLDYPYTRQYADTPPFIYQIAQSAIWGMGAPLGALAWIGSAIFFWQWWRTRKRALNGVKGLALSGVEGWRDGFILAWVLVYFLSIGGQYAKYLRYLLPLLPFLFLMSSVAISRITHHVLRFTLYVLLSCSLVAAFAYSTAFSSIYAREHPWIEISRWMYRNIPADAPLIIEHWDDQLPVSLRDETAQRTPLEYRTTVLPMYDADDAAKLETLVNALSANEYIVLATPRLFGTIPRLSERYPMSARYYRALFDGRLGFDLETHALNAPALNGIVIFSDPFTRAGLRDPIHSDAFVLNWGYADESFIVYDHPMPLIFKKVRALAPDELRHLLSSR